MTKQIRLDEHRIEREPYYLPIANEVELTGAAYETGMPLLLKTLSRSAEIDSILVY